jgi:ABC-type transport system substrate-binding protein
MLQLLGSDNWGRLSEPAVDRLFEQQKVELDEQKRAQLVRELQKEVIQKAWWTPGLWWTRLEVRSARIHNYEPMPSHWMNPRLEEVWHTARSEHHCQRKVSGSF